MKYRPIDVPPAGACAALQHRRRLLLERVAALRTCPDSEFAREFPAVVNAVEAAFRHEEALLELLDEACLHPRRADHASILCALHRTVTRVEGGDLQRGREVAAALEAILGAPPLPAVPPPGGVRPAPWTAH